MLVGLVVGVPVGVVVLDVVALVVGVPVGVVVLDVVGLVVGLVEGEVVGVVDRGLKTRIWSLFIGIP